MHIFTRNTYLYGPFTEMSLTLLKHRETGMKSATDDKVCVWNTLLFCTLNTDKANKLQREKNVTKTEQIQTFDLGQV